MKEQFKRVQVIMLPMINSIGKVGIYLYEGHLGYNDRKVVSTDALTQHLYIISDEEIKESDWYYDLYFKEVFQCRNLKYTEEHKRIHKKIIATTDSSLLYTEQRTERGNFENLPFEEGIHKANFKPTYISRPSQQFIEKYIEAYNKGEIITDVLVEYHSIINTRNHTERYQVQTLKMNPRDNTITIKKLKDSWSREEVFDLMKKSLQKGFNRDILAWDQLEIWIKEKL